MTEAVEFVFEDVERSVVASLFVYLLSKSAEVVTFECTEDVGEASANRGEILRAAIASMLDLSILAHVRQFEMGQAVIPSALVRMVKCGINFDIDVSFDANMCALDVANLQAHVLQIAEEFSIMLCYAGLEPAADSETRFFTNQEIGPLTGK
jgi:hypothetical protein